MKAIPILLLLIGAFGTASANTAGRSASCVAPPDPPREADVAALVQCVHDAHVAEREAIPTFVATFEGPGENPAQSLAAMPPFERYPVLVEIGVDAVSSRTSFLTRSVLPGGFEFRNLFVQTSDGKVTDYDLVRGFRTDDTAMPGSLARLDPLRLAEQLAAAKVSWLGTDADGVVMLRATRENGTTFEAGVQPRSAHLVAYRQVIPTGFTGEARFAVALSYGDDTPRYLPRRLEVSLTPAHHAPTRNVLERTAFSPTAPRDVAAHGAAGFATESREWRPARAAEPLSERAWLLRNLTETRGQWSYNVVAVDTPDGWWILEAPVGAEVSTWIAEQLARLAPDRKIAGVVQSHHHHDHLSGIEAYLDPAQRVVSTGATAAVLENRFDYRRTQIVAPEQSLALGAVGDDALQVHAIGADLHAGTMLVTWLARERTLFQADLVNLREYPDNAATHRFREWIRSKRLPVQRIVGVHGDVLEGEELAGWLAAVP